MNLCKELEHLVSDVKKAIIIVVDLNFPEIDWESCYPVNKSFGSTAFLNTFHKLLLLQHVNFPTRARGTDIPHLLDLVITDDYIIQKIEPLAPLGKSDHAVLIIETNVFSQGSPLEQKLNYDKGDYEALRSYVNCNWNKEFATVDSDVEALWNLLKDKIDSGIKCCIPLTTGFRNTKWKRPLNDEIRDQINSKKKCLETICSR